MRSLAYSALSCAASATRLVLASAAFSSNVCSVATTAVGSAAVVQRSWQHAGQSAGQPTLLLLRRSRTTLAGGSSSSSNSSSSSSSSCTSFISSKASSSSNSSNQTFSSSSSSSSLRDVVDMLMAHSHKVLAARGGTKLTTDEDLRARYELLISLDFSLEAITKAAEKDGGVPYVSAGSVAAVVRLLRAEGFSQLQLDRLLVASDVFTRSPADVVDNLHWLREEFKLTPAQVAKSYTACPTLPNRSCDTLRGNWREFEKTFRPTPAARSKLMGLLRRGSAHFLLLAPQTVREKARLLQGLLHVTDAEMPNRIGALAELFCLDFSNLQTRYEKLQEHTGLSSKALGKHVLWAPTLLHLTKGNIQDKVDDVFADLGEIEGQKLLARRPDMLTGAKGCVGRNLRHLEALRASPLAARMAVVKNPRLANINLSTACVASRVAFLRNAYDYSADEVMERCYIALHRSLHTVAPRIAYYQSQLPGVPLLHCRQFTNADAVFCSQRSFDLPDFQAFKQRWAASSEVQELCRHEKRR